MHRHHALFGQDVVEIGERRLLHFAGVAGAADQHDATGKIAGDHGFRAAAVALRIGVERRQIDDRQIGKEVVEFAKLRPDQQIANEQRMPGEFGEDAGLDARRRLGGGVEVLHEQLAALGVFDEIAEQGLELIGRDCAIVVPPDGFFGRSVAHDELVFRAAAGVHAGFGDQRAASGDPRLAAAQRFAVELRRLQVPVNRRQVVKSEAMHAIGRVECPSLPHLDPSLAPVFAAP